MSLEDKAVNRPDGMNCEVYRHERLMDCFDEVVGLRSVTKQQLDQILEDISENNTLHHNRMKQAHALFEQRYGRKA